jgi:phosphate transport system substrate-binding protein
MRTACRSVLNLAAILLVLVVGVSLAGADESVIRVYGATTFAEPIQIVGTEFVKEHPDLRVKVLGKTTEFGFQALLNGEGDLAMATRKPTDVERRLAERKRVQWKGVPVAWENVAVISHPGVLVNELTVDQLQKIYTGDYKNWRDVGGADLPILPHSMPYRQDDVAVWFADNILSTAEFTSGIIRVKTPDFLVQHVSVHLGSVAFLGNFQLTEILRRQPQWKVQVISIRADPQSPAYSPSADISKRGDYPLTIPLFLFWNENDPNKRIEQFAQFCKERLQEPAQR